MKEINATAAAAELANNPDSTLLLDVREAQELAVASIDTALHIPMGEIPARHMELDRDRSIICMCHLGGRSAQVAAFLEAQGFSDVINLAGGIDAWSLDVDTDIPRY